MSTPPIRPALAATFALLLMTSACKGQREAPALLADAASYQQKGELKAAVIQLTKALGLELAFKGVRVNAIAPGWIVTDLNRDFLLSEQGAAIKREIPVGRFGEERDLDGALLLLVSDAGRFIAGTTLVVDGGQMVALRG